MELVAIAVISALAAASLLFLWMRGRHLPALLAAQGAQLRAEDALERLRLEEQRLSAERERLREEQHALAAELRALSGELSQSRSQAAALATSLAERDRRLLELRAEQQAQGERLGAELASAQLAARELASERSRAEAELAARTAQLATRSAELIASSAQLASAQQQSAEKLALLESAERRLTDSFQNLSGEALTRSTEQLLKLAESRFSQLQESAKGELAALQEGAKGDLAQRQQAIDQLVAPVRTQLDEVGKKLQEMEVARSGAYEGLSQQVRSLVETQGFLRSETQRLVAALRAPQTRGRWAEIHLRRVVELAGLQDRCDFLEQPTVTGEDGTLRPDMLIQLPGGSQVVIDAKAPLAAWLEAHEAGGPAMLDDAQRKELYVKHARQVRTHVEALARKAYWEQFEKAPDFVVLFLPTEAVLGAALEADPELHELAMAQRVVLATPMTLIALLRTVAYGWRQDALAQNARAISENGRTLYERLAVLAEHFAAVGKKLKGAVESYNDALGSFERRVLPAARKFKEYQAVPSDAELPALLEIEVTPRALQAAELTAVPESAN